MGADELERASPAFVAAVRWALFAEAYGSDLDELRRGAKAEMPDGLTGAGVQTFMASRQALRDELAERERVLFPEDD